MPGVIAVGIAKSSHYQVTFGVLAVAVGAYALLQSLVIPVLATIQDALHTSQSTVTWLLTAYLLSASIFTPIIGRIGDKVGKDRMLVFALVALAVGSLLAAVTTDVTVMIVARAIQGVGGGVIPLAFGIIRDEFPPEKVPGAVGIMAALIAVGAGLGVVLAGPIVDALNFHWLFWIPLIMVVVAGVAAAVFVPESPTRAPGRISVLPAVLLSAWLITLLVALSQAPAWGWGSSKVLGLLIVTVPLAAAWVLVERRSAAPLIDMQMMRLPAVWTANLVALLIGVGMYASLAFLPQFLQTPHRVGYGFGVSITESGVILLPTYVAMFLISLRVGRLTARFGAKPLVILGTMITVGAYMLIAFAHTQKWEIYLATAVMGLGLGLVYSAMSSLVVVSVPPEQTGVASGMNANIRTIGGSVGTALMASIVTAGAGPGGLPKESGYTNGFTMLAAATFVALLAALTIPATRRAGAADPDNLAHPELALVAGGTVAGDQPE
ncbi:MAG: MFS transporter [Frankia sp.]